MTATGVSPQGARERTETDPLHLLSELTPSLVPVLFDVGEKTWPRYREAKRRKFGVVGPIETIREIRPRRFEVLLRKRDLFTLNLNWRLEAGGPVEYFEWDDSGRVGGTYGVRYSSISIAPVLDESGRHAGFAINTRAAGREDGAVPAIDARIDSSAFIRGDNVSEIVDAVKSVTGKPRVDEARPGIDPTHRYHAALQRQNRSLYFATRGANEYIGPGWSPESIRSATQNPDVRALRIAHPDEPGLTPEPMEH